MAVEPLPIESIRSIIKWELQQTKKGLFGAIAGKDRMARDDALSALADRIAKRFETYTVLAKIHDNEFSRFGVPAPGN